MAIAGMFAFENWATEWDGNLQSHTFSIELPPFKAFAQVSTSSQYEWDDKSVAECAVVQLRHRPPTGPDQVINLPGPDTFTAQHIAFDSNMSNITIGLDVKNCWASWLLQIFAV